MRSRTGGGRRPGVVEGILVFLLALLLAGCGGGGDAAAPAADGAAGLELGQNVYENNCASCHGLDGEGQANWQEPTAEGLFPAPPHDGSGHTWHHPDSLLLRIIAEGGQTPQSQMPGYAETLSREEMEAVLSYIKTFWAPEQRAAQEDITNRTPE